MKSPKKYPKSAVLGFFQGAQEPVRNSRSKRAISIRVTEVLLFLMIIQDIFVNSHKKHMLSPSSEPSQWVRWGITKYRISEKNYLSIITKYSLLSRALDRICTNTGSFNMQPFSKLLLLHFTYLAYNVEKMLNQRWFNVSTLNQRWFIIISMLCAWWETYNISSMAWVTSLDGWRDDCWLWSDCMNMQFDQSLSLSSMPRCWQSHDAGQIQ